MKTPAEVWNWIKGKMKTEWKIAFLATFLLGLVIHMPMLLSDIPNHDGLASMYFDQNMITSGRWFLIVACGFSSYYSLPWLIGILSLIYISITSVIIVEMLGIKQKDVLILTGGLLVAFPSLASNFAYVFTMDGYMLGLLLAVLAVYVTGKGKYGFLFGAVCLAFSLGIYQAYLPFAILLSIYMILIRWLESEAIHDKIKAVLSYLFMGMLGAVLYFITLQVLLKIQGKVLDTYQGISGMGEVERAGLLETIKNMYADFAAFTLNGNVLIHNGFTLAAMVLLSLVLIITAARLVIQKKWWKKIGFYLILVFLVVMLPLGTNIILLVSPGVTYHLLMRYQWVLYPILMAAFIERYGMQEKKGYLASWGVLLSAGVLVFCYGVMDNIGYSNLQKKYEKTYAYCIRLLDRIEQTEGYYQGIPVAMIGVVGEDSFPVTDITEPVTSSMIGVNGDMLLYTGANYEGFMKHYLGATLNFLPAKSMAEIYYSEEYRAMDSFPGENSVQVVDGILYIKTENVDTN